MEIRKFEEKDILQAIEICDEVREHHRDVLDGYFKPLDKTFEKQNLINILNDEKSHTLVAVDGSDVLGLLITSMKSAPYLEKSSRCEIEFLGVNKNCRGRGIGKKLMSEILSFCKKENIDEVRLGVFNQNESAYKFYQSCGFKALEQRMNLIL